VEHADVRVVQAGDRLRLALETRSAVRVGTDVRRKYLDVDRAIEAGVAGAVDLTHAAFAQLLEDLVRPDAGAGDEAHGEPPAAKRAGLAAFYD
jgi:hypothetical protein